MKEIKLIGKYGSNKVALVDDIDYERISMYRWFVNDQGYALTSLSGKNKRMHRMVLQTETNLDIDHINRDKLDNRRTNLRIVTRTQNNYNIGLRINNKSGHTGVSWFRPAGLWRAYIGSRPRIELGYYKHLKDAIKARKVAERSVGL